jgi:hypothetical protein
MARRRLEFLRHRAQHLGAVEAANVRWPPMTLGNMRELGVQRAIYQNRYTSSLWTMRCMSVTVLPDVEARNA